MKQSNIFFFFLLGGRKVAWEGVTTLFVNCYKNDKDPTERVKLVLGQTYSPDSMISYADGREANLSTGTRENIPSNRKAAR